MRVLIVIIGLISIALALTYLHRSAELAARLQREIDAVHQQQADLRRLTYELETVKQRCER